MATTADILAYPSNESYRMSCADLIRLTPMYRANISGGSSRFVPKQRYEIISEILNLYVVPIICTFGIVGNVLNLLVLTRKQLVCTMKHMERSVNVGMVALAVSDTCLCVVYLSVAFISEKQRTTPVDNIVELYFRNYREPMFNIFLLCSTWLTVIMALSRYVAVCRPLHARSFINMRGTRIAIISAFLGSIILNLPRFWHYHVVELTCAKILNVTDYEEPCSCSYYVPRRGQFYKRIKSVYDAVWSTIAVFVPFIILVFCNACLILALRESRQLQQRCRANRPGTAGAGGGGSAGGSGTSSGHNLTPTLIVLVLLFITLVSPSEFLAFIHNHIRVGEAHYDAFMIANAITNVLQLLNFTVNIVLYCSMNVQFRRTLRSQFCRGWDRRGSNGGTAVQMSMTKFLTHNTTTFHISDTEAEIT